MLATQPPTRRPSRHEENLIFCFTVVGATTGPLAVVALGCLLAVYRPLRDLGISIAFVGPFVGFFAGTIGGPFRWQEALRDRGVPGWVAGAAKL